MKTCLICQTPKPLSDFHKRSASSDGHQAVCKSCACARKREHYEDNKVAHRASVKARQMELNAFIDEQKNHPCMDCGESYPPYVMDFDHRPDEIKLFGISKARNKGFSLEKIQVEIDKCDLICSNCHRERTFQRYGNRVDGEMV